MSTLITDEISQLEIRLTGGSALITLAGTDYLEGLLASLVSEAELQKLRLQGAQRETFDQFVERTLHGIAREEDPERLYVMLLTEAVQVRANIMMEYPHHPALLCWGVRRALGIALPEDAIRVLQPYVPAYNLGRLRVHQILSDEAIFESFQALVDLIGGPIVSSRTIREHLLEALGLPRHGTPKAAALRRLA